MAGAVDGARSRWLHAAVEALPLAASMKPRGFDSITDSFETAWRDLAYQSCKHRVRVGPHPRLFPFGSPTIFMVHDSGLLKCGAGAPPNDTTPGAGVKPTACCAPASIFNFSADHPLFPSRKEYRRCAGLQWLDRDAPRGSRQCDFTKAHPPRALRNPKHGRRGPLQLEKRAPFQSDANEFPDYRSYLRGVLAGTRMRANSPPPLAPQGGPPALPGRQEKFDRSGSPSRKLLNVSRQSTRKGDPRWTNKEA